MTDSQMLKGHIEASLTAEAAQNASDLVMFLENSKMQFELSETDYWRGKQYWYIKYQNEFIGYILINGYGVVKDETEPEGWIVWFEEDKTNCFADFPADDKTKEIAWANVDMFGGDCGGGHCEGIRKVIFGRVFESLYRTIIRFDNPGKDEVECMKKLIEIRKNDIDNGERK